MDADFDYDKFPSPPYDRVIHTVPTTGQVLFDTWGEHGPVPPRAPSRLRKQHDLPPLHKRIQSVLRAYWKWIRHGSPTRSKREINRLLKICQACDRYDEANEVCRECGCPVKRPEAYRNKLLLKTESCPLGKW